MTLIRLATSGPRPQGLALWRFRLEFGDFPLEVALAVPGQILHQNVAGTPHPAGRQGRTLGAEAGNVPQLGTQFGSEGTAGVTRSRDASASGLHGGIFRVTALANCSRLSRVLLMAGSAAEPAVDVPRAMSKAARG